MNPAVMAVRTGTMAVLLVAFVTSMMSSFLRATLDPRVDGLDGMVLGQSAWTGWGLAGCGMMMVALFVAITALIVSIYAPLAAKILDFLTAAVLVLAIAAFAVYIVTYGPDVDLHLEFTYGFGWSGIVTLFLLVVAALLAVVAGILTKTTPRQDLPGYISQAPHATR